VREREREKEREQASELWKTAEVHNDYPGARPYKGLSDPKHTIIMGGPN
jgi:hypothetical protein